MKLLKYEKSAYFTHRNECSAQLMIPTNLSIFLKTLHFNSHPTMRRWIHATGYGTAFFLWENYVFSTVHTKDCMEGATLCRMHWKLRQKLQIFILSGFSLAIFIWILIKLNNINFYGAKKLEQLLQADWNGVSNFNSSFKGLFSYEYYRSRSSFRVICVLVLDFTKLRFPKVIANR